MGNVNCCGQKHNFQENEMQTTQQEDMEDFMKLSDLVYGAQTGLNFSTYYFIPRK